MNNLLTTLPTVSLNARTRVEVLVSRLVGQAVSGVDGTYFGNIQDVVVQLDETNEPTLRGLLVESDGNSAFIRAATLLRLEPRVLAGGRGPTEPFQRQTGDLLVSRDLLDRWLVDVPRWRIVRASDAVLRAEDGTIRLTELDVSADGIARRLGPRWLARLLSGDFVAWMDLEVLVSLADDLGLPRQLGRLSARHPADLARLAEQFHDAEGAALFVALDDTRAAAVLEEIQDERQAALLKALPRARAIRILHSMEPDAAADVLDDLETREANAYLAGMEQPQAGFIREALDYPKDSAGGLMNPEFPMSFACQTVREVVASLRTANAGRRLEDWYVFVVGDTRHPRLVGIVSPPDLLAADPEAQLADVMQTDIQQVPPGTTARAAARLMADYNLLVLPVVDHTGEMLGVITADDALDVLIPTAENRR